MKENYNNLDRKLESSGQEMISKMVKALPEEPVSMVWRSELNEALRAQAATSRRRKTFLHFLSPVAGLGLACALAVFVLIRPTAPVMNPSGQGAVGQSSLEASLVQLHQDDLRNGDVAGTGLDANEAVSDVTSIQSTNSSANTDDPYEF